jgi:hypothetical protein
MNGNSKVFIIPLVVMIVGFILAFFAPLYLRHLFAAVFFGLAVLLVMSIRRTILKGELRGRFGSITLRHSSPIGFWFGILIYAVMAFFLFFLGLALFGLAPHWFTGFMRK